MNYIKVSIPTTFPVNWLQTTNMFLCRSKFFSVLYTASTEIEGVVQTVIPTAVQAVTQADLDAMVVTTSAGVEFSFVVSSNMRTFT